jgi:hypothetical protein
MGPPPFFARTGANALLRVLSAIEAGRDEVLADDWTRQAKAGLGCQTTLVFT